MIDAHDQTLGVIFSITPPEFILVPGRFSAPVRQVYSSFLRCPLDQVPVGQVRTGAQADGPALPYRLRPPFRASEVISLPVPPLALGEPLGVDGEADPGAAFVGAAVPGRDDCHR